MSAAPTTARYSYGTPLTLLSHGPYLGRSKKNLRWSIPQGDHSGRVMALIVMEGAGQSPVTNLTSRDVRVHETGQWTPCDDNQGQVPTFESLTVVVAFAFS